VWHVLTEKHAIPVLCKSEVGLNQHKHVSVSSILTSGVNFMIVFLKECSVITCTLWPISSSYVPCTVFSTTSMSRHLVVATVSCNTCISMHLICVCRKKCYITVLESSHMSMQSSLYFLCFLEKKVLSLSVVIMLYCFSMSRAYSVCKFLCAFFMVLLTKDTIEQGFSTCGLPMCYVLPTYIFCNTVSLCMMKNIYQISGNTSH
jgi:hypothetical protein